MPTLTDEPTRTNKEGKPRWHQTKASREFAEIFTYAIVIVAVLFLGLLVHAAFDQIMQFAKVFFPHPQ